MQQFVEYWVSGGGFGLDLARDGSSQATGFPQQRDSAGQQIGAVPITDRNPQGTLGCSLPRGAGSDPAGIYKLQSAALIDSVPHSWDTAFSPDGKLLALRVAKGVLLVDVPATLEQGKLVPRR